MSKSNQLKSTLYLSSAMLLIAFSSVFAEAVPENEKMDYSALSEDQFEFLIAVKNKFEIIERYTASGRLTGEQAAGARVFALNEAEEIYKVSIEPEKLQKMISLCRQDELCRKQSLMDKFGGLFNFINIVWFMGGALIAIGLASLFFRYSRLILKIIRPVVYAVSRPLGYIVPFIVNYFKKIPGLIYELMAFALWILLLRIAWNLQKPDRDYAVMVLSLLLIPQFIYSHKIHLKFLDSLFGVKDEYSSKNHYPVFLFLTFIIWSAIAVSFENHIIGFFAVIAFLFWMGFSMMILPLEYVFGFPSRQLMNRSTAASFILVAIHVIVTVGKIKIPYYSYFQNGINYCGSFVLYLGILIMSSKYVCSRYRGKYLVMQIVTVVFGLAALFFGSVYDMFVLRGVGGTFFSLYLLEKFFELPWGRGRLSWAILLSGSVLYGISHLIFRFPEYFFMK